ncbi:hypothetical protein [Halogeometricum borinquense]|uniref:hypothetical protein n=1 Tax=Halogeometricum borinquense TaxID=60847 RepID=UPI001F5C772E|nr:hypothetical protein [Halogeometricum borinquense]
MSARRRRERRIASPSPSEREKRGLLGPADGRRPRIDGQLAVDRQPGPLGDGLRQEVVVLQVDVRVIDDDASEPFERQFRRVIGQLDVWRIPEVDVPVRLGGKPTGRTAASRSASWTSRSHPGSTRSFPFSVATVNDPNSTPEANRTTVARKVSASSSPLAHFVDELLTAVVPFTVVELVNKFRWTVDLQFHVSQI